MEIKTNFILENGELNDSLILKREILYKGPNGRQVDRIFVLTSRSYILKLLSTEEKDNKEIWIYENILPLFPPIYPKIISSYQSEPTDTRWIIYEDLGNIHHLFTKEIIQQVIDQMVRWHSVKSGELTSLPLTGAKPKIEEILNDLNLFRDDVLKNLSQIGIDEERILMLFKLMETADFTRYPVFVHGDLHLGNYGFSNGRLVIMDWEYVHINCRYFDLYHLLDISHPLFPKTMENELRQHMLQYYYKRGVLNVFPLSLKEFAYEYYLYSCIFSMWMIILIQKDLVSKEETWPKKALKNQMTETLKSFNQCLMDLYEIMKN